MSGIDSSSQPSHPATGLSQDAHRRNTRLGILNGVVGQIALAFLHPELVLVGVLLALAAGTLDDRTLLYIAAAVTAVSKAGVLGPQLFVGSFMEHLPRKKPTYVLMVVVRGLSYAMLVVSVYLMGGTRMSLAWGLGVFFAAYLVASVTTGSSHAIYTDMVGRIIPIERVGRFMGLRNFLGGGLGALAAVLVMQPMLNRIEQPLNYVVLIATGAMLSVLAMIIWLKTHEPDGPRAKVRTTFRESLRRGFAWLRVDHNYRCYFWLRVAFRVNYLGLAFFIPYGRMRLNASGGAAAIAALTGIMVATERTSRVLAALVWGKLADRSGFRACLVCSGVGFLLLPLLALAAPRLPTVFELAIPGTGAVLTFPLCVYLLALAAWGAAIQASIIGGQRFYIGSAPPHRRISYMGFQNTVTSPLTLLPFAGAALAARFGVEVVFLIVVASSLLYLASALRIIPEHKAVARRDGLLVDEFHAGGAQ